MYFLLFICNIFVCKIFFCNKSMMLNNFIIDFFPVSCTVFEIKTVTPNLATRWYCQWFPCIAHGNFTIPRPNFYDYSSCRYEIIGVTTDFNGHTVFSLSSNFDWYQSNKFLQQINFQRRFFSKSDFCHDFI